VFRDPVTGEMRVGVVKVRYSHDAFIDVIVANPSVTQREIAATFGYTEGWVSQVMSSDAFKARLEERREEIVDPVLRASVKERIEGLAMQSLEVLKRKLEGPNVSDKLAAEVFKTATMALGFGARSPQAPAQTNFVVVVPPTAVDSKEWEGKHRPAVTINHTQEAA